IINNCVALVDKLKRDLPQGTVYDIPMNNNDFLYASINNVVHTLIEAFILVFFVVYLFLQDFRSTLIPAIAIPVALIGTFFAMKLIGFSINLITLSALVLAIAIVVDDAIVVVEAVHAKLDQGYTSATSASIDAMDEIAGALISITLVMMLVFIPVSFMPGTSGVFYQQFGLTMAIAIGFSAVNALTLSPALCAIFLRPKHTDGKTDSLGSRMSTAYKAAGEVVARRAKRSFALDIHPLITFVLLVATITFMVLGWYSFSNIALSCMAWAVAIVAVLGIFGKRFQNSFEKNFERMLSGYKRLVGWFGRHKIISFSSVIVAIGVLVWLMSVTPSA
ncbi:MAG: efflux RND transporter permease subunit, partial [Muribaculaceae bacterium]|nr:efflux RND transporter permease subunit [Muribaculaceae bacterium]